jgi:hypothetical protein
MKFRKPIEDIKWEIQSRAQSQVQYALNVIHGYNSGMQQSIDETLARAIGHAVAEGFKVMMENQYTDEDFEKDIGLKP